MLQRPPVFMMDDCRLDLLVKLLLNNNKKLAFLDYCCTSAVSFNLINFHVKNNFQSYLCCIKTHKTIFQLKWRQANRSLIHETMRTRGVQFSLRLSINIPHLIDEYDFVFLGIDFKQKLINLDGVPIKLQIWDVSWILDRKLPILTRWFSFADGWARTI